MDNNFCAHCGVLIEDGEGNDFNGEIFCENCWQNETVTCSECGTRILWEDNGGCVELPLCRSCYNENYTVCQSCGRIIRHENACYCDENDEDSAYCGDCYDNEYGEFIHEYGYKPEPIFYGFGRRFFGVELEIDDGGKLSSNAECILKAGNFDRENIYIKSDASLDDGMEIVTHPMTLDYHKYEMPWLDIVNRALELKYRSHKTSTCGLHVHVNRNTFGDSYLKQEDAISRVLYFVEHHWNELLKFSRRTEDQMRQWANRYGYKNNPKDILQHAKTENRSRYTCVNLTNDDTVEFRMFRGTLKYNTLIATLELVDKICDIAINLSDEEIHKISWSEFVTGLDESDHRELITYLKERQLYVNSPVYGEEDV